MPAQPVPGALSEQAPEPSIETWEAPRIIILQLMNSKHAKSERTSLITGLEIKEGRRGRQNCPPSFPTIEIMLKIRSGNERSFVTRLSPVLCLRNIKTPWMS